MEDKLSTKLQHPFFIKTLQKLGIEETQLNIIKALDDKPTAKLMMKKPKAFPLRSEQDKDAHCCHFSSR